MRVNQAPLCAAALHLARDDISIAQTAALGLCAKNKKTRGAPARGIQLIMGIKKAGSQGLGTVS